MRLHDSPRRTRYSALLWTLVGGLVVVSTAQPARAARQAGQAAGSATPQAAADAGGIIDRVLVRIDGRAILYSDFEAQWNDTLAVISAQFTQAQIDAQAPELRMNLMMSFAQGVMLELRAEDLGIVADVNDVDRAIMGFRESNDLTDDDAWAQALAQGGLTETMLREIYARQIVQSIMSRQEISRRVFVSQAEIETYYEHNQDTFSEPEQVLFQQMIFVFAGDDRASVRERAESALAELRAGVSLTTVGNTYAIPAQGDVVQDASQASWVAPEDLLPEILAAVNNLTPLDYSELIEGNFGYYIIQLMDRKEGRVPPLEEVTGYINGVLRDQKTRVELEKYAADLMKNANIEIYAEEFNDLRNAWTEGNEGAPTGTSGRGR